MKLHLPKTLLTAVIAAFAIVGNAYSFSVTNPITSYNTIDLTATTLTPPEGYTIEEVTFTDKKNQATCTAWKITGANVDATDFTFVLDASKLDSLTADQHLVWIDRADNASWGLNAMASGKVAGYWFDSANNTNSLTKFMLLSKHCNK